jgi:hypothetical protein
MLSSKLVDDFVDFVARRERIRAMKESGLPKPWTSDPILQNFRFCNVHREDDKVTKWFAKNWRSDRYWDHPNLVPAIMLGRTINWPDTLEYIGFPDTWDRRTYWGYLNDFQRMGKKVYTGAYMITAGPTGVSKNEWVTGNAEQYFTRKPKLEGLTLESAWTLLTTSGYPCVGPFIAGQVVADLKYTPVLKEASDWWDWAAVGPGSTRGLNRLFERNLKDSVPQAQGLDEMLRLRRAADLGQFHLQDVQNCLCEFDKYERVKYGQGKPRSSYPGTR